RQTISFSFPNGSDTDSLAQRHTSATVPTLNRPTAAPTHVLQTGSTSKDRPTSLIRGIRGRVECDDQIDEANQHGPFRARSDVTTRTSREGNPTLRHRPRGGSPEPGLGYMCVWTRASRGEPCRVLAGGRAAVERTGALVRGLVRH